jgi:hypothetical protein
MIIFKSILKKYDNRMYCKLIGFGIATVTGAREEGNEMLGFHKVKEIFFDQQGSYYFKRTTLFHRILCFFDRAS